MTHQIVDATIEPVQDPSKRYRCRHIFIDGHRCGSPSLRGEHLCYYHHTSRGFADEKRHRRTWADFELPPLEDRSSVLAAINEVLQRIACDNIPAKQAGLLLYGLQIASKNLPEAGEAKAKSNNQPPVEQVLINPRYGDLAPVAEFVEDANPAAAPDQISNSDPTTLPSLNASVDIVPPSPVILSEVARSFIASGAVEGPGVAASLTQPQTHVISTEGEAAAERPLSLAVAPATNPSHPAKPEINITNPAPGSPTWYPNNCHANEKRTSRPPHSAHRHQAAQRRRSRRCHELHGLQLA
jgi:hypothetical protein